MAGEAAGLGVAAGEGIAVTIAAAGSEVGGGAAATGASRLAAARWASGPCRNDEKRKISTAAQRVMPSAIPVNRSLRGSTLTCAVRGACQPGVGTAADEVCSTCT